MQHVASRDVCVAHVVGAQPVIVRLLSRCPTIRRHVGDPDEARERRASHLDLVEPREQAIDRIGELLDVEHDRRDLANRGVARSDEPSSPGERRDDGQDVGDVDRREPDRPQAKREPLRGIGVGEVRVDPPCALVREPERLHRATAVDGLARRAGERGIRGTLPEVSGGGIAQIPAGADDEDRHADEAGKRRDRAHPDRRADDEERRDARDRGLGDREPHGAREGVDVGRRPRDEIADSRPLDGGERQRENAPHEIVPQLGEHPLGEHER